MSINSKLDSILREQTSQGKHIATLTERVPEDLKERLQSLTDAQTAGCPALDGHKKAHRKAWWGVALAFIVAIISLFKDALSKTLGVH